MTPWPIIFNAMPWSRILFYSVAFAAVFFAGASFSSFREGAFFPTRASLSDGFSEEEQRGESSVFTQNTAREVVISRIIDGDTVELFGEERVRLIGIDAPESGDCFAEESAAALTPSLGKTLRAERDVSERDRYGRLLFYFYDGDVLVNQKLVEEGAVKALRYFPDTAHADDFAKAEQRAREAKKGLWGACGAIRAGSSPESASSACTIKGNISSSGERIYHSFGCGSYEKTRIDVRRGERWFCSVEEAQEAGWRAARNCP